MGTPQVNLRDPPGRVPRRAGVDIPAVHGWGCLSIHRLGNVLPAAGDRRPRPLGRGRPDLAARPASAPRPERRAHGIGSRVGRGVPPRHRHPGERQSLALRPRHGAASAARASASVPHLEAVERGVPVFVGSARPGPYSGVDLLPAFVLPVSERGARAGEDDPDVTVGRCQRGPASDRVYQGLSAPVWMMDEPS